MINAHLPIGAELHNAGWSERGFAYASPEQNRGDESPYNISGASSTTEERTSSEEGEEYTPGTFEGPEKTMEVVFRPNIGAPRGLRNLSRAQLDDLCAKAKCSIMSMVSNHHLDAYVLSESSLFVYEHRLVMKTCGTTTLLRCLGVLLSATDTLGMELAWLGYSRKNFLFPAAQMWPHSNFGEELHFLGTHPQLQQRLGGQGHILGPVTGDHWFVYVAESINPCLKQQQDNTGEPMQEQTPEDSIPRALPDLTHNQRVHPPSLSLAEHRQQHGGHRAHCAHYRTMNLMMFDMAPEVAQLFFQGTNGLTGKQMTAKAGIQALCPGATIDEQAFSPCGYSMNAILHDAYSTIHITPESECSYVSFETNTRLRSYCALVRHVLSVFRPRRFVLTMFGDQTFLDSLSTLPTARSCINLPRAGCYRRSSCSSAKVEQQLQGCVMACYSFHPAAAPLRRLASSALSQASSASESSPVTRPKVEGALSSDATVSMGEAESSVVIQVAGAVEIDKSGGKGRCEVQGTGGGGGGPGWHAQHLKCPSAAASVNIMAGSRERAYSL